MRSIFKQRIFKIRPIRHHKNHSVAETILYALQSPCLSQDYQLKLEQRTLSFYETLYYRISNWSTQDVLKP